MHSAPAALNADIRDVFTHVKRLTTASIFQDTPLHRHRVRRAVGLVASAARTSSREQPSTSGSDSADEGESSGEELDAAPSGKAQGMSAARRKRISESMKGKNRAPKSSRHAQKIGKALAASLAKLAPEERLKRCSKCGGRGHNAATCVAQATPQRLWVSLMKDAPLGDVSNVFRGDQQRGSGGGSGNMTVVPRRGVKICSICGQPGHNKLTCPLKEGVPQPTAGPPSRKATAIAPTSTASRQPSSSGAAAKDQSANGAGRTALAAIDAWRGKSMDQGGDPSAKPITSANQVASNGAEPAEARSADDLATTTPSSTPPDVSQRAVVAETATKAAEQRSLAPDSQQAEAVPNAEGFPSSTPSSRQTDTAPNAEDRLTTASSSRRTEAASNADELPSTASSSRRTEAAPKAEEQKPNSASNSRRQAGESLFGKGLWMDIRDDPHHLGPVPSSLVFPLPTSPDMAVKLAWTASYRAWLDGERLQTLSLPAPSGAARGSPGLQQQFKAVARLCEALLAALKKNRALQGPLRAEVLDDVEAVGKWEGDRIAAVVFPNPDTLALLRTLVHSGPPDRLVMCINPQWSFEGNVVSDFGLGAAGTRAEAFARTFQDIFYINKLSVQGDSLVVMRVYPGGWQIHWNNPPAGSSRLLAVDYKAPPYSRLVELLRAQEGSQTSMSWVDRVRNSFRPLQGLAGYFDGSAASEGADDIIAGASTPRSPPSGSIDPTQAPYAAAAKPTAQSPTAPAASSLLPDARPRWEPETNGTGALDAENSRSSGSGPGTMRRQASREDGGGKSLNPSGGPADADAEARVMRESAAHDGGPGGAVDAGTRDSADASESERASLLQELQTLEERRTWILQRLEDLRQRSGAKDASSQARVGTQQGGGGDEACGHGKR